jgi:hypothetical protein
MSVNVFKKIILVSISLFLISSCANRTVSTLGKITEEMKNTKICLIAGLPNNNADYTLIKRIKFGKGSYGRVNDALPSLIDQAKVLKADAIINYEGSQRFGFWPWRITRPILRGDAIVWAAKEKVNCEEVGGVLH